MHYTTNGKATTDASEIGLWFYPDDQVPKRADGRISAHASSRRGWDPIPPFVSDHEMKQTITVPKDAYIYSMLPHMHFRGKRMRFYAEYPDGKKEELLNIAKLQLQLAAQLRADRAEARAGRYEDPAVGAFDNSTQNKANPDPARKVPWGQQSWDEMFFGSVTYKFVDQSIYQQVTKAN